MAIEVDPRFSRGGALDEIERIYAKQQKRRAAVGASAAAERIAKLRRLRDALMTRRPEIHAALWADYRKPAAEVDLADIYPVTCEIKHAIRHLRRWMRPRRVSAPLALLGTISRIHYEPKGVALIVAPWNFPVNLTLGPLVSAIAAGNCAVLKPSEMTTNATTCMKKILADLFDEDEVAVIDGDASVAEALLKKRWDHIFFTGSPAVGKIVMRAAAEFLTSVTLELGGKSPVIVDRTANLDEAAKKIAWGKFFNSGQICIAPDYLLVDETIRAPFVEKLKQQIAAISAEVPDADPPRGWMVNERHGQRIKRLFDTAVERGAEVVAGGEFSEGGRAITPTVLANVPGDAPVMQEEIFGPLLPMMTYRDLDEALRVIDEREKPLVLYIFSRSRAVVRRILGGTRAGGTAVNETLLHFYQLNLPFGGVGNSGVGKSHGFFGFEAFSNARGILSQPTRFGSIQLMYPPYTKLKKMLIDLTLKWF